MITDENATLPFPVLGIAPTAWSGQRKLARHGGASKLDEHGMPPESEILALVHGYHPLRSLG